MDMTVEGWRASAGLQRESGHKGWHDRQSPRNRTTAGLKWLKQKA